MPLNQLRIVWQHAAELRCQECGPAVFFLPFLFLLKAWRYPSFPCCWGMEGIHVPYDLSFVYWYCRVTSMLLQIFVHDVLMFYHLMLAIQSKQWFFLNTYMIDRCFKSWSELLKWADTGLSMRLWVISPRCPFIQTLYTKSTDTHQYLHASSCHPLHCKASIPYSQALRNKQICSSENDFRKHTDELQSFLINRGYNTSFVKSQTRRASLIRREDILIPHSNRKISTHIPLTTFHPNLPTVVHY